MSRLTSPYYSITRMRHRILSKWGAIADLLKIIFANPSSFVKMLISTKYNTFDINIIQHSSAKVKHLAQFKIKKEAHSAFAFLLFLHNLFVNFCPFFHFIFAFGSISPSHVALRAVVVENFSDLAIEHGVYTLKTYGNVLVNRRFAYSKRRRGTSYGALLFYYVYSKSARPLITIVKQAFHLNTSGTSESYLGLLYHYMHIPPI